MKVRDLMQRRVTTVDADEPLGLALQLMLWREVHHLPVLRQGRLVGLLSERDLLRVRAEGKTLMEAPVKEAMSAPVAHVHPNADVADAAADMSTRNLGCLPVVDGGELIGILTRTDVLADVGQQGVPRAEAQGQDTGLRARDLMTPDPVTVGTDQPLVEAAAQMASKGIRHLCVVDSERRIVGMLSDRDLRSQIGDSVAAPFATSESEPPPRRLSALKVTHAMTEGARTASLDTPLADLVNILLTEHIGAIPVVDEDERLQGIVSYVDVLRALAAGVV